MSIYRLFRFILSISFPSQQKIGPDFKKVLQTLGREGSQNPPKLLMT